MLKDLRRNRFSYLKISCITNKQKKGNDNESNNRKDDKKDR